MTVTERNEQLKSDANVKSVGKFSNDLPAQFVPGQKLVKDAILEFPAAWTNDNVKERIFNGKSYTFAIIKMILPDGTETSYDFYPNSEVRPGFAYKLVNGKATFDTTVPNKGDLYNHMVSYIGKADKDAAGNVTTTATQKAMDALLNKKCKVVDLFDYETPKFENGKPIDDLTTKQAHTINWA